MSTRLRILLADDSKFFRAIESKFLQKTPVDIMESENCSDTVTIVRNERPDLVYLYFALPDEGGAECCRQIKSDHTTKGIPVVMICDTNQPQQVTSSEAAGCDAVLVKPLDRLSFLQAGRQFLEIIREHRQPSFFPLRFSLAGEEYRGKCLDISGGGMFIESQDNIPVGRILDIEFKLPDAMKTRVLCKGEVMWVNSRSSPMKPHYPNGLGIRFVELTTDTHKAILRLADK